MLLIDCRMLIISNERDEGFSRPIPMKNNFFSLVFKLSINPDGNYCKILIKHD
jgi:hypothetical protein